MSNTGTKIVLTLKEIATPPGSATGNVKPDLITDPNYIAPYTDLSACPITFNTSCPLVAATSGSGIEFEFSLPNSVVNNPAINLVKIIAFSQSFMTPYSMSFPLPNATPNYFHGTISPTPATYSLNVQYFLGSSFVRSCSISGTVYNVNSS